MRNYVIIESRKKNQNCFTHEIKLFLRIWEIKITLLGSYEKEIIYIFFDNKNICLLYVKKVEK